MGPGGFHVLCSPLSVAIPISDNCEKPSWLGPTLLCSSISSCISADCIANLTKPSGSPEHSLGEHHYGNFPLLKLLER